MTTSFLQKIRNNDNYTLENFVLDCTNIAKSEYTTRPHAESFYNDFDLDEALNNVIRIKEKLNKYRRLTKNEIKIMMFKEKEKEGSSEFDKAIEEIASKDKYLNMLQEIKHWNPQKEDFKYLKKFCESELNAGLRECDRRIDEFASNITDSCLAEEWIDHKIQNCENQLDYWSKKYKEVKNRLEPFKKWKNELEISLCDEKCN